MFNKGLFCVLFRELSGSLLMQITVYIFHTEDKTHNVDL